MEILRLSCPNFYRKEGYEIYQDIHNKQKEAAGGKQTGEHNIKIIDTLGGELKVGDTIAYNRNRFGFLGSIAAREAEENEQLKKYNIVVGHLAISVILPNGKNFTYKQEYYMSAYDIVHLDTNKNFSLYISSFLYNKFSSFKQKAVNEYMKKGYRAPQNEITKYLLNDGRELVMTRGK